MIILIRSILINLTSLSDTQELFGSKNHNDDQAGDLSDTHKLFCSKNHNDDQAGNPVLKGDINAPGNDLSKVDAFFPPAIFTFSHKTHFLPRVRAHIPISCSPSQ